ncbi:TPA: hypothetical protein U1D20_000313 [Streptococcus suis]|nr:hypothetical protein [Streptococcus suis]
MKKIDWIEYFEAVNGRAPEEAEILAALEAGEFEEEQVLENVTELATEVVEEPTESVQVHEPVQEVASQINQEPVNTPTPQVVVEQQSAQQSVQQPVQPAQPSAFGSFFNQFKVWVLSALKAPTSVAAETHKYNGWVSLALISFFAALTIYIPMNSITSGINGFTNQLSNNFSSLLNGQSGYDSYGYSVPQLGIGLDILFKSFIGIFLIIFSTVFAGFVVKRYIYKEEKYTFTYTIEYYGRLFAVNAFLLAIAALAALLGLYTISGIASWMALTAMSAASVYAIANFKNSTKMDSFYRYILAIFVNGLIVFISVLIAFSIIGRMFLDGLF